MSDQRISESVIEEVSIAWFEALGWETTRGPEISPDGEDPERLSYDQVILHGRLKNKLHDLNPGIPREALEDAFRRITRINAPSLEAINRSFHLMLVYGINIEYRLTDGNIIGGQVAYNRWAEVVSNISGVDYCSNKIIDNKKHSFSINGTIDNVVKVINYLLGLTCNNLAELFQAFELEYKRVEEEDCFEIQITKNGKPFFCFWFLKDGVHVKTKSYVELIRKLNN